MKNNPTYAILAGIFVVAATSSAAQRALEPQSRADGVTITVLANEGVMLASGKQKVLIDALTSPALTAELRKQLESLLYGSIPRLAALLFKRLF